MYTTLICLAHHKNYEMYYRSERQHFCKYGIYALFPHDLPQTHSASKGLRSKPLAGTRHALSIEMSYHQHIVAGFCSVIVFFVI